MSAAVMKNPVQHASLYGKATHAYAARNEPTPAQLRRLRKKVRRLARLVQQGRLTVEVTE